MNSIISDILYLKSFTKHENFKFGKSVKKAEPVNKKLYLLVLKKIKSKEKVWPSAYASGRVVKEYKKRGGKYKTSKTFKFGKARALTGLTRWFKEKWVNVCVKKNGKYTSCAKSTKKYPYCRPSIRITSKTPKTVKEISNSKLKKLCKLKKNKSVKSASVKSASVKSASVKS